MTYPFDITKINYQLSRALQSINAYTRDNFPLFFSTRYLAPNAFHDVLGRQNYFPSTCGTSEALTILGVAFFKAFEATNNQSWRDLALNCAESYRSYFHIDDLFNTTLNGINTPLVRNHWLSVVRLNKDGSNQKTEGFSTASLNSDPFYFGHFLTATFTNGVAQLNSDLSRVFKVYNGILEYKNVNAPLRSGTQYTIEYWISDNQKTLPDGTKTASAEPNGRVKVVENITGTFQIIFARFDGLTINPPGATALQGEHFLEPYPIWYKTKQANLTYTGAAFDAYWWSYEMYELAFKHTNLTKYNNAKEVIKWNTINYASLAAQSYFYKRDKNPEPLSYSGSYILQYAVDANANPQTLPGYTASRETVGNKADFVKLVINANTNVNIFSGVELQNYVTQVLFDPLVIVRIEAASTIQNVLEVKVSLSPNTLDFSQEYYAFWLIPGDSLPREKLLTYQNFKKFENDNVWHPRIAENPVFVFNGATWSWIEENIENLIELVTRVSIPDTTAGCGLINARFSTRLPKIRYKLEGLGRFRFRDAANNLYYLDVADTGGMYIDFNSSWLQSFGINDRLTTELVFENTQTSTTVLYLQYCGEPGRSLPSPVPTYKTAVVDKSRLAHTTWIGDFQPLNNPLDRLPYTPGSIPFTINTLNGSLQGFRGKQFFMAYQSPYSLSKWGYLEYAKNVVKMFSDSQDSYRRQSVDKIEGLLHQVFLPYDNENIPYLDKASTFESVLSSPIPFLFDQIQEVPSDIYEFNQFSWRGLDPNTEWAPYCFRAMEDLSRYYLDNQGDRQARKVLENYIKFAYQWCIDNPNQQITNIIPEAYPQARYAEPHAAAIEGITAININRAGIQKSLSWFVIQTKFNYIDNQFVDTGNMYGSWCKDQPTFTHAGQTYQEDFTFWKGKIIEFYSLALTYRDEISQDTIADFPVFPKIGSTDGNYHCDNPAHFIDEIIENKYPIIEQEYADRTQQRVLLNTQPKNKEISLRFDKLSSTNLSIIVNFYNQVNQGLGKFVFDTTNLPYTDFDGIWIFAEKIKTSTFIANKDRGLFNVEIRIRRIG